MSGQALLAPIFLRNEISHRYAGGYLLYKKNHVIVARFSLTLPSFGLYTKSEAEPFFKFDRSSGSFCTKLCTSFRDADG